MPPQATTDPILAPAITNVEGLQGDIANDTAVIFDQVGNGTYAGSMTGVGTLTKLLAGAVIFSGSNGYAGSTTVADGELLINGSLTSSDVTVANGGLLGGSGTIAQNVAVQSGGVLSPGNSPGLLTLGSLDLQAGSSTFMEIIGSGGAAGIRAGFRPRDSLVASAVALGDGGE